MAMMRFKLINPTAEFLFNMVSTTFQFKKTNSSILSMQTRNMSKSRNKSSNQLRHLPNTKIHQDKMLLGLRKPWKSNQRTPVTLTVPREPSQFRKSQLELQKLPLKRREFLGELKLSDFSLNSTRSIFCFSSSKQSLLRKDMSYFSSSMPR